jgi:hypothetical protein
MRGIIITDLEKDRYKELYNSTWRIRYIRPNKNSRQKKCEQYGGYIETTDHFKKRIKDYMEEEQLDEFRLAGKLK